MTHAETFYLALVLIAFSSFALVLATVTAIEQKKRP